MKTPLDFENTFEKTLLYWLSRYLRSKTNTLSNRKVQDHELLSKLLNALRVGAKDIVSLEETAKGIRKVGVGLETYYTPLIKLHKFLINMGLASLKEVDEDLLKDFLTSATGSLSSISKNNHRVALINFFNYIDKNNENDNGTSYTFTIELKNWGGVTGSKGKKLPSYMNEEEVNKFKIAIDEVEFTEKTRFKLRFVIKMALYTGLRSDEILSLKWKDINLDQKDGTYTVRVIGKGDKEREVFIKAKFVQTELNNIVNLECKEDLIICNKFKEKQNPTEIRKAVKVIIAHANIQSKEKNALHMLRHSYATLLYKKSKDLVLVKDTLGHSTMETTVIYTHLSGDKKDKLIDLFD